jgi:hypothetical protein
MNPHPFDAARPFPYCCRESQPRRGERVLSGTTEKTVRSLVHKTLLLLLLASPIAAQNCALCYTQAAGSGSKLKAGLRSGILILIFPPMMICTGLIVTAYKRRNRFHQEDVVSKDHSDLGW